MPHTTALRWYAAQKTLNVYPAPPSTLFGLPAPISRILEQRSQRISLPVKPENGAGWMGESSQFTPEWIAEKLATHFQCAAKAGRLGEKIRSLGGADAAIASIAARAQSS